MNRRVSYGCSELRLVGETQADLDIVSFLSFFILCSCDKANLLPKVRDSLCLWIAICLFNILCRRITLLEILNFMLLEGFGQGIWGGYGHCQNILQVSDSSLKNVQFLLEFFVKMHPTDK